MPDDWEVTCVACPLSAMNGLTKVANDEFFRANDYANRRRVEGNYLSKMTHLFSNSRKAPPEPPAAGWREGVSVCGGRRCCLGELQGLRGAPQTTLEALYSC